MKNLYSNFLKLLNEPKCMFCDIRKYTYNKYISYDEIHETNFTLDRCQAKSCSNCDTIILFNSDLSILSCTNLDFVVKKKDKIIFYSHIVRKDDIYPTSCLDFFIMKKQGLVFKCNGAKISQDEISFYFPELNKKIAINELVKTDSVENIKQVMKTLYKNHEAMQLFM